LFVYRDLFAWIDEPFKPPPLLDPATEEGCFLIEHNLDSRNGQSNFMLETTRRL